MNDKLNLLTKMDRTIIVAEAGVTIMVNQIWHFG